MFNSAGKKFAFTFTSVPGRTLGHPEEFRIPTGINKLGNGKQCF